MFDTRAFIKGRTPRELPEPYRAWTDPKRHLPEGTTHIAPDAMVLLMGGLALVLGTPMLLGCLFLLAGFVFDLIQGQAQPRAMLCSAPFALAFGLGGGWLYRLWFRHLRWKRDAPRGRLREGMLIGDDAVVVWMPGVCHLIPRDACIDIRTTSQTDSTSVAGSTTTSQTLTFEVRNPSNAAAPHKLTYALADFDTDGRDEALEATLRRWAGLA